MTFLVCRSIIQPFSYHELLRFDWLGGFLVNTVNFFPLQFFMEDYNFSFHPPLIKVVGVGGGGSNVVNRMIEEGIDGVDYWK